MGVCRATAPHGPRPAVSRLPLPGRQGQYLAPDGQVACLLHDLLQLLVNFDAGGTKGVGGGGS